VSFYLVLWAFTVCSGALFAGCIASFWMMVLHNFVVGRYLCQAMVLLHALVVSAWCTGKCGNAVTYDVGGVGAYRVRSLVFERVLGAVSVWLRTLARHPLNWNEKKS